MAVRVTCGNAGLSTDGLDYEDHPVVVIEPHGVLPAEMYDELTQGAPIVISAATFADGTDEGEDSAVRFMQKMRVHSRARHKAEREQQSRRPTP
jgi:hypothetical protein